MVYETELQDFYRLPTRFSPRLGNKRAISMPPNPLHRMGQDATGQSSTCFRTRFEALSRPT